MADEKLLHALSERGALSTENGIRVVDASKLGSDRPIRKTKAKKLPPVETVALSEPVSTPAPRPTEEVSEIPVLLPPDTIKESIMADPEAPTGVGLDVGTSFLVAGRFESATKIHFKKLRDCFLELEPKSPINQKFIKRGLDDRKAPYIEKDGSFFVLGEDAFLMANERHVNTRRPMHRGVLSPTEKEAFPILKELLKRIVGEPRVANEKLVFSVPAKPIDANFDQLFHQDMLRSFLKGLGFDAQPMNEAEALAYSELLEEGLTGIAISCGAGMMNVAVMSSGDPVVTFSTSRSGDWVDAQAAIATNTTNSIVQQEKEGDTLDLANPDPSNQIHAAIAVYYGNLLVYTLEQIAYDLSRSPALPKFKDPIPLVVAGGTSLPKGFIEKFKQALSVVNMPVTIRDVQHASDPLHAVANGLTLAASMK